MDRLEYNLVILPTLRAAKKDKTDTRPPQKMDDGGLIGTHGLPVRYHMAQTHQYHSIHTTRTVAILLRRNGCKQSYK